LAQHRRACRRRWHRRSGRTRATETRRPSV
jgi:hypothetical protein